MLIRTSLALLVILAATAHADTRHRHGGSCAPKYTSRDLVGVDERGIYNGSSSATASVTCPIDQTVHRVELRENRDENSQVTQILQQREQVHSIRVYGRDLSTTVPLSCYMYTTEEDGFSSWGPTKYACSSGIGCNDSTTEFTGNFSIVWNVDVNQGSGTYVGVACNIPPTTSAGSSYVKSVVTTDSVVAHEYWDNFDTYISRIFWGIY